MVIYPRFRDEGHQFCHVVRSEYSYFIFVCLAFHRNLLLNSYFFIFLKLVARFLGWVKVMRCSLTTKAPLILAEAVHLILLSPLPEPR